MNFRIRNPDSEDFTKHEKAYYQHLGQFRNSPNTDLWKFFGWDFFHDGAVKSIEICGDLKTVVVGLNCPNVKRFKSDGDYEYINVGFACTFKDVSIFTIRYETPERSSDVRRNPTVFLDAEINTSPSLDCFEPQEESDPESHASLLMRLLADDSTIWVELVFSQVDVTADEPTAFALMESDPRFEVPTYSRERDERAD
jgi:hypothetical protein